MSSLTILTGPLFAGTQSKYHMTQKCSMSVLVNSLIGVCAVCIYPHSSFRVCTGSYGNFLGPESWKLYGMLDRLYKIYLVVSEQHTYMYSYNVDFSMTWFMTFSSVISHLY